MPGVSLVPSTLDSFVYGKMSLKPLGILTSINIFLSLDLSIKIQH